MIGLRGVLHGARRAQAVGPEHPLEQLLRAGLAVGHAAGRHLLQHGLLALDADHLEAAIGERERQRQPHAAQADDRDLHRRRRSRRYWRANAATKRGFVLR